MGVTFKIEGAQQLQAALKALPEKVSKRFMKTALHEGAEIVLDAAKADAPVGKTGNLKAGLEIADEKGNVVVRTGQGNKTIQRELKRVASKARKNAGGGKAGRAAASAIYAEARTKAKKAGIEYQGQYYGNMVERGTKKMAAHPFIAPALRSVSDQATAAIADSLKDQIEEEGLKG